MLALVSEFNCFLRSRCSMEMWCPDDVGRDSWDWVGPPAWGRACFNSPEWGGGSSPVKNGASPDCIIVVVVDWYASLDVRCGWSQRHGDAMSPRTNLHVTGHRRVRLPVTQPPWGALDDEELFIVEGSKNPRNPELNPFRENPKNGPNPPPNRY